MQKTPSHSPLQPLFASWRKWWRAQTPNRQDRFAFIAPLAAVVLFMAAITAARYKAHGGTLPQTGSAINAAWSSGTTQTVATSAGIASGARLVPPDRQLFGL